MASLDCLKIEAGGKDAARTRRQDACATARSARFQRAGLRSFPAPCLSTRFFKHAHYPVDDKCEYEADGATPSAARGTRALPIGRLFVPARFPLN